MESTRQWAFSVFDGNKKTGGVESWLRESTRRFQYLTAFVQCLKRGVRRQCVFNVWWRSNSMRCAQCFIGKLTRMVVFKAWSWKYTASMALPWSCPWEMFPPPCYGGATWLEPLLWQHCLLSILVRVQLLMVHRGKPNLLAACSTASAAKEEKLKKKKWHFQGNH